jgi:hypothetical protein
MAITEEYFNPDLATGLDDGTSEANAWQTWASMIAGHVAGGRVNAKKTASRYAPGADIAFSTSATDLLVSIFRGYGSTIGDGTKFQFDMSTTFTLSVTGEGVLFQCCDVTGSDATDLCVATGDSSRIEDCIIVNTGTSTSDHDALRMGDANAFNCYIETNSTGSGSAALTNERGTVDNCIIVSTRRAMRNKVSSRASSVVNCLMYAKGAGGTIGMSVEGLTAIAGGTHKNLTIDGFATGINSAQDDIATSTAPFIVTDSIISNATTGLANTDNATKVMTSVLSTIAFYNCTTDTQYGDNEVLHKISLTADPYTDAANDDYSLNNTAGGGADCRAVSIFGAGQITNYRDIGALQHEDTGGGGDPFPSQGIQSLGTGLAT